MKAKEDQEFKDPAQPVPGKGFRYMYKLCFWEEGSRPGRMKMNLVSRTEFLEAKDDEAAVAALQRVLASLENIAYRQSSICLVVWHDSKGQKWQLESSTYGDYIRWTSATERPAFYAELPRGQQHAVAQLDRIDPQLAAQIANQFRRANENAVH